MSAEAATSAEPGLNDKRPILTADRLRMSFGGVVALNDVSIEVRRDELIPIIGTTGPV
jgi:branched-chain amino acid transport system ATP-binding protein